MKRKFLLIASAVAIMASCTQQEELTATSAGSTQSEDIIGFRTNTTRASLIDLLDLQDDDYGFAVYATSTTTSSGDTWFLDGSNYYKYSSDWGWDGTSEQWPTDVSKYPITFFALYSATSNGVGIDVVTSGESVGDTDDPLSAYITIQDVDLQQDIIAATVTADTKPSDGKLTMTFNHILSKVDFGIVAGYNKKVYVSALSSNNLDYGGTYSFSAKGWSDTYESFTNSYDLSSALSDFSEGITGTDNSEATATAITNTSSEKSLMLLPQSATASSTDSWVSNTTPSGTYIEMQYRAEYLSSETGEWENSIGYAVASDHGLYESIGDTSYVDEPLFVKVGYPLSTSWAMGSNYTYNIRIGTADATNGYLLDDYYYNSDGERTLYPIDFDTDIGEAISDGEINFNISVVDWVDEDAQYL